MAQLAIEDHTGLTWEEMADTLVFEPLGLALSTYEILDAADRGRVAVGYRADGAEVAGGGWHAYPETAPASLWTTSTEYAAFVVDVMRSYGNGTGVVLVGAPPACCSTPTSRWASVSVARREASRSDTPAPTRDIAASSSPCRTSARA